MLYQYAIDPGCLNNWDRFSSVTSGLGVSHGRLLSRFPNNWFNEVQRACNEFTFRQRQQMGIELARIRESAHRKSALKFDKQKSWVENAIDQYPEAPFHAILTGNCDSGEEWVIKLCEQLLSQHTRWQVPREKPVKRTLDDIANAVSPLMEMSNKIIFVDRNFAPANERWQDSFTKMLEVATQNRNLKKPNLEYYFVIDTERLKIGGTAFGFDEYCRRKLEGLIPPEAKIRLCRLAKRTEGEGIHARYILTDRGGIRIDWGLDGGKPGETTDVGLMDSELWKQRWNEFQNAAQTFEILGEVTLVG